MKKIISLIVLLAAFTMNAQDPPSNLFRARELQIDAYGSALLPASQEFINDARLGIGAGLNYFFTQSLGAGLSVQSENPNHSFLDEARANFYGRLPLKSGRLAPYVMGGPGYDFEKEQWFAHMGGGAEWRFNKTFGIFSEVEWIVPVHGTGGAETRAGLRLSFR